MKRNQFRKTLVGLALFAMAGGASGLMAAEAPLFGVPLADQELDQLRGGFFQEGLEISIGLDQIVSVNGQHMVVNRLTIPNLNQRTAGRAVEHQLETVLQVVQPESTGSGARVETSLGGAGQGWTTIIQNSLNSTVIRNIHQLNIELNNLGARHQVPQGLGEHLDQLLTR